MCGIVCYVGKKKVKPILLEGLKRLEYRGYDSAGLAIQDGKQIELHRAVGKIAELEKEVNGLDIRGTMGIAHTRWATHGEPTEENAHPQRDQDENTFVIHNGIIENYLSLKRMMERQGIIFRSETDTEVLAQLIGLNFNGSLQEAVRNSLSQVEGTFGLAVIHKSAPGEVVVARRGSPLVIGVSDHGHFVGSDITAMVAYTNKVVYLQDNAMATLTVDDFPISTAPATLLARSIVTVDWPATLAEPNGFPYFMLKKIYEPAATT